LLESKVIHSDLLSRKINLFFTRSKSTGQTASSRLLQCPAIACANFDVEISVQNHRGNCEIEHEIQPAEDFFADFRYLRGVVGNVIAFPPQ
jgi:hypothetical protein